VTTGQGGALLVNDRALAADLPGSGRPGAGWAVWLLAAAVAASRSTLLFGLLSRLPGVAVGESHYDAAFETGPAPRSADGLANDLVAAVVRQRTIRSEVAGAWRQHLAAAGAPAPPAPAAGTEPAHLRLPLFATDAAERARAVQRLAAVGMPYVGSYPEALSTLAPFRPRCVDGPPVSAAPRMAETIIALPCHASVTLSLIRAAAAALGSQ
jgi:dTDP-4-amino-4,6-dideoxygalactose transaminase